MNPTSNTSTPNFAYPLPMFYHMPPNVKPYYPFAEQQNAYPSHYQYQYAPSTSYYCFMNQSVFPPNQVPQPAQASVENYKCSQEIPKLSNIEVIDLDHTAKVKQEFQEKQVKKYQPPQPKKMETKNLRKFEKNINKTEVHYKTEEQQLRTFHLSNTFNKLLNSLLTPQGNHQVIKEEVETQLTQMGQFQGRQNFFNELYIILSQKFQHFKKTKEQMIKYIIRRTYHNAKHQKHPISIRNQFQKLQQFHQRNLKQHKSMNNQFLKKQFSHKLFLHFYQQFYQQVQEQFQKQNQEKIVNFANIITSSWIQSNLKQLIYEKKLPWTLQYKNKIKNLTADLLRIHRSSENITQR